MEPKTIFIPADVPQQKHETFKKNYAAITHNTNRFFMFSCDQKIEHLNFDFYGQDIHPNALHPEHFFRIASQGKIGAMATHLGLIARYGNLYPEINYIAKLNGKTNLIKTQQKDPMSSLLWNIDDVLELKNNNKINICGVGITVYLGSEYEPDLLSQAAHMINQAHQEGLVTIVWMYLRGKAIAQDNDAQLIAGAGGVAVSLGADFVKVKAPTKTEVLSSAQVLKIVTAAAGNTQVILSGGKKIKVEEFLQEIYDYIHIGGAAGSAIGRNIFQRSLQEGIALTHAMSAIVFDNVDYQTSMKIFKEHLKK